MKFYCVNCKDKLSDTENTALCPDCQVKIIPFLKFINKEKDKNNFSAIKSYELNKDRLVAKSITESGLEYILNYCKCLDENNKQDTIKNNQPNLSDEAKKKDSNDKQLTTHLDETNLSVPNKAKMKITASRYCCFIGIILIIFSCILSSSEDYESSFIAYPVFIGLMAFIGLVMFITSIFILASTGTKEQEIAEKKRIDQLAITHGFKEFIETAGNNIFAIDEINDIWHGTYIRNMNTYTCFEKLSVITGYSIEPFYKEKHNSLGRAVAGGILFGATGAIIGALTSSSKQILTNDCYLTISTNLHDYGTQRYQMKTSVGKNIVSTLDILYDANKLGIALDNKLALSETTETQVNDSRKKLFELKTLFEQNLITNEEYANKRKEIIDKL